MNAPDVPATPDPPQPKHLRLLGLLDWLPMIVLGSILSLGGAIAALQVELLVMADLILLFVFVVRRDRDRDRRGRSLPGLARDHEIDRRVLCQRPHLVRHHLGVDRAGARAP